MSKDFRRPEMSSTELLGLPGLRPVAIHRDGRRTEIVVEYLACQQAQQQGTVCGYCTSHGARSARYFAHHPEGNVPVRLMTRGYRLTGCGNLKNERPAVLDPRFGMTTSAAVAALVMAMDVPFAEVARRLGVGPKAVAKVFKAVAPGLAQLTPSKLPTRIGMDGVHDGKKSYTVVADLSGKEGKVIELLPTHDAGKLREHIEIWPCRDMVKVVVIDPSSTLRPLVRDLFPNARIVVDLRHVAKKALDAANAVRVFVGEDNWEKDGPEGAARKVNKQIIEKRTSKLTPKERARLDANALLAKAYQAKEDFFAIYSIAVTPSQAAAAVEAWWNGLDADLLPYFRKVHKLVTETWGNEFLAHFRTKPRITTAFVEAANRTLKGFIADARGQHDPDRLRAQMLFRFGTITQAQLAQLLYPAA